MIGSKSLKQKQGRPNENAEKVENAIFISGFDRRRTDIEDIYDFFERKYRKIVDINQPKD